MRRADPHKVAVTGILPGFDVVAGPAFSEEKVGLIAEVAIPVPVHHTFHYRVPDGMNPAPGSRVRAPFGPRMMIGIVVSVAKGKPERPLKSIDRVLDEVPLIPAELLECAGWLSVRYSAPIGECLKTLLPPFLKTKGRKSSLSPEESSPGTPAGAHFTLTPGQEKALGSLERRLREKTHHTALIYGVPASGKTEVYLRLIRQVVAAGGQALFLVPEISLTGPFFEEFKASLKAPVVLWHSRLAVPARREAWLGLGSGKVQVVVGARSAVLLPFKDLRLIVIDEEQDESFKQEGASPLYHARDTALHRGREWGALVVLGSATPSLETWQLAKSGTAEVIQMPDRVSSVNPPGVRIVKPSFSGGCLSEELVAKLRDRLNRKEQSILLVNRRGFATLLVCQKCGWVERCGDCGVAKIQHQTAGGFELLCHHCDRRTPMPERCGKCANPAIRAAGTGTQRVVAELKTVLRGAKVLRMDKDTLSKEGREEAKIYKRFLSREADILVGTKLVAKSFHFPEVTLVGVVDADTMMHMPDFRASERTMQMLAQVAGRSGRAHKKGEVVIQTLHPEHEAISCAAKGDYAGYAEIELEHRRELSYPPFSMLIRLLFTGAEEDQAAKAAQGVVDRLGSVWSRETHTLLGPSPAVLPKKAAKFRYHALVKLLDAPPPTDSSKAPSTACSPGVPENLAETLAEIRRCEVPSGVRMKVNVDPYDLF